MIRLFVKRDVLASCSGVSKVLREIGGTGIPRCVKAR